MRTCLIIDDSPVIRKVAKRILADMDFAITEAESGADGLVKCRSQMPDVILLDHTLPDMTDLQFIETIKARAGGKMPMILLNIFQTDVVRIMKAKRAGATGYVLKPFTRATLTASFAHQLAKKAA
jgi:two-component system, chemotaxis family, chemotaxis protein CheY